MKELVVLLLALVASTVYGDTALRTRYNLKQLVVVFRHGDRSPDSGHLSSNDPYRDPKFWPMGWGELTEKGKQRTFELGKYIQKNYFHHLMPADNESLLESKIYIRSTNRTRTVESARILMTALLSDESEQEWNKDLLTPFEIYVSASKEDWLYPVSFCPSFFIEGFKNINASLENITKEHPGILQDLADCGGYKGFSKFDIILLGNALQAQNSMNYSISECLKKYYPEPLNSIIVQQWKAIASGELALRIRAGSILKDIVEHFQQRALNVSDRSLVLYSAHDLSLVYLLVAMNVEFSHPPPYSAALIFELLEDVENENKPYITVSYRNSSDEDPHLLKVKGCESELCPLDVFVRSFQPLFPKGRWNEECFINDSEVVPASRKEFEEQLFAKDREYDQEHNVTGGLCNSLYSAVIVIVVVAAVNFLVY